MPAVLTVRGQILLPHHRVRSRSGNRTFGVRSVTVSSQMWSNQAAPVRKRDNGLCETLSDFTSVKFRPAFNSECFVSARSQHLEVFEERSEVPFSPKRRLFLSPALTSRRCGVSPIEGLLSFTSFLHFSSWLPVNAEAHSWSERRRRHRCLQGPSDYNPASWKTAVVCRRGTCQRSPGRLPPLQLLAISMLRKSKE